MRAETGIKVSTLFGHKCSWWHPRRANDALASEPSIFSENHDYKFFSRVAVNTYAPIYNIIYNYIIFNFFRVCNNIYQGQNNIKKE